MIQASSIPDRCACRWTSKVTEPGWTLEKAHPGCRAEHEKENDGTQDPAERPVADGDPDHHPVRGGDSLDNLLAGDTPGSASLKGE